MPGLELRSCEARRGPQQRERLADETGYVLRRAMMQDDSIGPDDRSPAGRGGARKQHPIEIFPTSKLVPGRLWFTGGVDPEKAAAGGAERCSQVRREVLRGIAAEADERQAGPERVVAPDDLAAW